jgi:RHS repeat-associated protein
MPFSHWGRARAWLPALAFVAGTLLAPGHAAAQPGAPTVTVSPGTGTYPAGQMSVRIDFSDNGTLDHGSFYVQYGTTNVTSSFQYVVINGWTAYATGTVAVTPGSTQLSTEICDTGAEEACGYGQVVYTASPPSVRVTPAASSVSIPGGTAGSARFWVVNTGAGTDSLGVSGGCTAGFWNCSASTTSVTLAGGDSVAVDAYFVTPASTGGTVSVTAGAGSVTSTGATSVTALPAPDPGFPGDNRSLQRIQRNACVTVAMGPASASECGDLRVVHALPGTRVLNRNRGPVLIYNSGHGRPIPIVAEHLAGPASGVPDSIRAVLLVEGAQVAAVRFKGWGAGTVRRIAVPFQAHGHPTGLYTYTLQVTAEWLNGTQQPLTTRTGRLAVVNRSGSPFGAGWWLSGLEELVNVPGDTAKLWIGGDGSTRVYRGNPGGPWVADAYDRPDTLYNGISGEIGPVTVRTLPGRSEVWFDADGRHLRTINRMHQYTAFRWSGSYLTQVNLPYAPGQVDTTRYSFEYNNNPAATVRNLSRVVAPGARDTWLATDASARVTRITDPDSSFVTFAYSGTTKWMLRRTDRRNVIETFDYVRNRFHSSSRPVSATENILIRVTSVVTQGISGSVSLDSVRHVYDGPRPGTEVCDCMWWHTDRYGAPTDVRDPFHQFTYIHRGDSRWPGRVTSVVRPGGFTTTAAFDSRGNLSSQTAWNPFDNGRNATTTYTYDPYWDAPTRVVAPEGEVELRGYDSYGRPAWTQTGTSTARRVNFAYNAPTHASAPGLPISVTLPGGAVETYEYDSRGNLSATQTPLGFRTETLSDAVGRVIRTRQNAYSNGGVAGWRSDTLTYDLADRPRRTVTSSPAVALAAAQQLVVENRYDREGSLTAVSRWSVPDTARIGVITTRWSYDLAGRQTVEYAPDATPLDSLDNPRDSTVYDLASNVVAVYSRRYADSVGVRPSEQLAPVTLQYDAANRLTKRRTPAVLYQPRDQGISQTGFIQMWENGTNGPYPWYPTSTASGEYLIAADSSQFVYDPQGRMLRADNADARVRRSYYAGGALRTDTLIVRTTAPMADGSDWTKHVYALEHTYDRSGRRVDLKHPHQLAPRTAAGQVMEHTGWSYDRETGALAAVTDPLGMQVSFTYNVRGELVGITRPSSVVQTFRYDDDGRMLTDSVRGTFPGLPTTLRATSFAYDPSGKLVYTRNGTAPYDTMFARYSGIGHLVDGFSTSKATNILGNPSASDARDQMTLDALGNRVTAATQTTYLTAGLISSDKMPAWFRYEAGSGRMRASANPVQSDTFHYDAGGNEVFSTQRLLAADGSQPLRDRASFYGADGRLRASELRVVHNPGQGPTSPYSRVFEEYRYDALGRRVWVRVRQSCKGGADYRSCMLSQTRRTVWDGDRELYEIQMPEDYAENDTDAVQQQLLQEGSTLVDPNPYWGRVAYTYGGGVDQPLSIVRMGYVDMRDSIGYPLSTVWTPEPFSIFPVWNERGQPLFGTWSNGRTRYCEWSRCARISWPNSWFAYERPRAQATGWHGTLLNDKQDATGTHYRRNRYYDPNTGRFTQEDPIGLAGGLNVYGFAAGDPVSYSDPYGLCPGLLRLFHGRAACDRWNARQLQRALAVLDAERAAGNPHALAVDASAIIPLGSGDTRRQCKSGGGGSRTGCTDLTVIRVNVDRSPAAISQTIVHEQQHVDHPADARGSEPCAQRRAVEYHTAMTPEHQRNAARGNPPAYTASTPGYTGGTCSTL